jgi:hypothetical protein
VLVGSTGGAAVFVGSTGGAAVFVGSTGGTGVFVGFIGIGEGSISFSQREGWQTK